jgi:uncharacterized protein with HEPN domain
MKREYLDYLDDILTAMNNASLFIAGMDYSKFVDDTKTIYAVVRAIEIIGEAVTKLSDDSKLKHPEIPWKDIAGMRNKLIHEYFGIDTHVVWDTVTKDIPYLLPLFEKMKQDFPA